MSRKLSPASQLTLGETLARWARKTPDSEAFVFKDRRITFEHLNHRSDCLAQALISLGIKKGDKVAILFMNSVEILECYWAAFKIGAVAVPINFRLAAPEIEYQLNQSDTKVFIFSEAFSDRIQQIKNKLNKIVHFICHGEGKSEGVIQYEKLVVDTLPIDQEIFVDDDDPAFILYTSGTTGRPKGAVLTHKNILMEVINSLLDTDLKHEDRSIFSAPLFHIAAIIHMLQNFFLGNTTIMMDKHDSADFLRLVEKEKVTVAMLVTAMWITLLEYPEISSFDTRTLRSVYTGGSVLPVEVARRALRAFPTARIYNVFGQTEVCATTTMLDPKYMFTKEGSVGRRIINLEARIVDPNNNDVSIGEVGEIVYRGPTVMREYYNNPAATEEAFRGGWFHSGDLVREDEDGFIWVVDRAKDMIISGAENIYPAEVEEALYTHPKITEAAVIGVPDPKWGESVMAIVVPQHGADLTPEEVVEHCKTRLASYKKPKIVKIVDELPRNATGKVIKYELRKTYKDAR